MEERQIPEQEIIAAEDEIIAAEQEAPVYCPRPMWQVWAARLALAFFIIMLIVYYLNIAGGGL